MVWNFISLLSAACRVALGSFWRAERTLGAADRLHRKGAARDRPARIQLRQLERVHTAVAELSVTMEVVLGPDDRDGAVDQYLGLPHAFEQRLTPSFEPFEVLSKRAATRTG